MTESFWRQPLTLSLVIHIIVLMFGLILSLIPSKSVRIIKVPFTIRAKEAQESLKPTLKVEVPITPLSKTPKSEPKHAVYGLNRKSIVSNSDQSTENSVSLKQGNTLAKAPDQETLQEGDEDSLPPTPIDEYLVSSMPQLISEVRIPYPIKAREANIDGPVVMELLIDSEGKVRTVTLISGPGYGLNEAALQAVKNFQFKPARVEDKTVAVKIRYTYKFVLENQ